MTASGRATTTPRRRLTAGLLALLLTASTVLTACAAGDDGGTTVTATFARAAGLFERSRVQTLGLDVGHVDAIEVAGDVIEVTLRIDPDVPLPADVTATIAPVSLIGERNVVLGPAYRPGTPQLEDGAHIPLGRTRSAPEPDDVLDAVLEVSGLLDRPETRELLTTAADALDGRGELLGDAIGAGGRIASQLRAQDDELLTAADGLADLAGIVNRRGDQLTELVDGYARALDILASDRDRLRPLLAEVLRAVDEGEQLVTAVGGQLPADLATLTTVAHQLEANTASIATMLETLPQVVDVLLAAYRPETQGVKLRFTVGPTIATLLGQVGGLLGLDLLDCVPTPDIACEEGS